MATETPLNRTNNTFRRRALIIGLVSASLAGATAMAQTWPAKPISLVVPFATGGTTDVLARALGDSLSKALAQTVIVENKPGAGATLGADLVSRAKPDGYTLLMGAVHHTIAGSVYKNLNYNFQKSFDPVTTVALVPNVLVVNSKTKASGVKELLALAKAANPPLAYGSNGVGTLQHLIGGQVSMSFDTVTPVLPFIQSGALRALAVTTAKRSSALPDVPTMNEAGMQNFDLGTWFGVLAPAGTPKDVIAKLNTEMVKIIRSPEFGKQMAKIGAEPIGDTSEQMKQRIGDDTVRFARLVKEGNITVDR